MRDTIAYVRTGEEENCWRTVWDKLILPYQNCDVIVSRHSVNFSAYRVLPQRKESSDESSDPADNCTNGML